MIAVKEGEKEWWRTTATITAVKRTDMVDILVKANADLDTQENVRYDTRTCNLYVAPYMFIVRGHVHVQIYMHNYCESHSVITDYWVDSINVCCQ